MKTARCLLLFVILIIASGYIYAGEIKLVPANPALGSVLSITYARSEELSSYEPTKAFIYCFDATSPSPTAYEVNLTPALTLWKAEFIIPPGTVYGLISIYLKSGEQSFTDDNKTNFWDFHVVGQDLKQLEYSWLRDALTRMGGSNGNINRRIDFKLALASLHEELKLYPSNIQANIGYASLQFDLKKISKETFESSMEKTIETVKDINDENTARSVVRALRTINKSDKADEIEKEFAVKFPQSETAEDFLLADLAKAESLKEFTQIAKTFFERYPNSNSREKIFSAVVTAFIQINKFDDLMKFINSIDSVPPTIYNQISLALPDNAELWPDKKKSERIAEALMLNQKAFESIQSYSSKKPRSLTTTDWNDQINNIKGSIIASKALIQAKSDDFVNAFFSFNEAITILGESAEPDIIRSAMLVCDKLGKDSAQLAFGRNSILSSSSDKEVEALYLKKRASVKDSSLLNIFPDLDALRKEAFINDVEKLTRQKLDIQPSEIILKSLDGRVYDLSDYSGKILVMTFFSTWCGPCQTMFPAINELSLKATLPKDVAIIAVDVWEKGDSESKDLGEFLKETEASFDVLVDETDIAPQKFGVTGLPTTLIFDQVGKLQFIINGFSNNETFAKDLSERIEVLRK